MTAPPRPTERLPPELSPRGPLRRRSPLRRLSLVGCALLSVLVLAVSAGGWFLYNQFSSKVTHDSSWHPAGNRPAEVAGDENILLLGDDSRDGTGNEYGGKQVEGIRSDTTIIAHFDKDGTATLLSFPRDELIPVVPRVRGTPADGKDKLTNILTYAGVSGLTSTLESLTGLHIDHYIVIDLAGFKQVVDAVRGVTVCVTTMPDGSTSNLNDNYSQWHGHLGENTLNGDQALAFVRTRHALGDERLRILRQQQFLSKLLAKTTTAGTLTNPVTVTQLLGAVGGALTTDSGLNLVELADRASKLGSGKVRFITIPTHVPLPSEGARDDQGAMGYHGDVLLVNAAEMQQILAPLRPAPPQSAALASAPAVLPSQVTVARIVNASGRNGLAGETKTSLTALGFGGLMTASTAATSQASTEVRYPAGQEGGAKALVAKIPGAQAVVDATLATTGVTVVLGSTFTGVTAPSAATGTAGAAAPGATAGGPVTVAPATPAPGTGGVPANTACTP
ncbi:LCP family protein [Pseudofrankia sp. DC12]|uniref:LCP family protein n=1 Tax=Pseudofrankia sp. DC12 TaxID=683315 RepID=UPI0005F7DB91|nr:LCP family protein [Pseudofrankia sp. DC12]